MNDDGTKAADEDPTCLTRSTSWSSWRPKVNQNEKNRSSCPKVYFHFRCIGQGVRWKKTTTIVMDNEQYLQENNGRNNIYAMNLIHIIYVKI